MVIVYPDYTEPAISSGIQFSFALSWPPHHLKTTNVPFRERTLLVTEQI